MAFTATPRPRRDSRAGEKRHAQGAAARAFWIARRAEHKPLASLPRRSTTIPIEVKKQAVFALSQLPRDEGKPLLIELARSHTHPVVRKQAMFWLDD